MMGQYYSIILKMLVWLIDFEELFRLTPPFGIIGDANQTNLPLNITNYSQHVITKLVANYKLFSTYYNYHLPLITQFMLRMSTRNWGIFFYARTLDKNHRGCQGMVDMSLKHDLQVVGKAM